MAGLPPGEFEGELVVTFAAFGALGGADGIAAVGGGTFRSGDAMGSRSMSSGGWISGRVGSLMAAGFPACACGAGVITACENKGAPPLHPSSERAVNIALGTKCLFLK